MKPQPRSQREGKPSDTPNVDAVRFDSAASADAAFGRFRDFTRRLITVPKSAIDEGTLKHTPISKRRRKRRRAP